jgi:hypothetical protein
MKLCAFANLAVNKLCKIDAAQKHDRDESIDPFTFINFHSRSLQLVALSKFFGVARSGRSAGTPINSLRKLNLVPRAFHINPLFHPGIIYISISTRWEEGKWYRCVRHDFSPFPQFSSVSADLPIINSFVVMSRSERWRPRIE